MAVIPIYIPTYISDQTYNPCRVQPRLLFFNGMIDCEKYYIESASAFGGISKEQTSFPYFDNYNVVSGSFPTTDSKSLLFYNEAPVYGELPDESLYSQYWTNYVQLIYNPRTRLLNASTIIPLADYFKMELNDIVELRGNYYHLRAINDYNLKNGECRVQLLGPILPDAVTFIPPPTTSTSTTSTSTTSTTTSSTTTTSTTTSSTTTTTLPPIECVQSVSFEVDSAGTVTYINCCGDPITNFFSIGPQVINVCMQDGSLFGSGATISSIVYSASTCNCTTTTTTTSTTTSTTTTTLAPNATLQWDFTEGIGADGSMELFVNGNTIENRFNTSNGTYIVEFGDTINVQVVCNTCGSPNNYSNAYSISNKPILSDADCTQNGTASILTAVYTVVSGDLGGTINLSTYATCDTGCI
jgi:hypothetical protein